MYYKHKSFLINIYILFLGVLLFSACKKENKNPDPDISHIDSPNAEIIRLEQLMAAANSSNYKDIYSQIESQYPELFRSYYKNFWGFAPNDTFPKTAIYDSLYANTGGNEWMNRLLDSVNLEYENLDDVIEDLNKALTYYKYYFPDSTLPQFYTYIGPFVYWTLFDSSSLGIELDMYMGEHFANFGSFENNMPQYIITRCAKPYIVINIMKSLVDGAIVDLGAEATILDAMLAQGKMLYYLDCMLPDQEDSVKMGYTEEQIIWCAENEGEIWKFLAGQELLFSKRGDEKRRYIDEAPTSVGMPGESPGRAAVWTGWQIVRSYMRENPDVTLMELFNEPDALTLLKKSGYEPGD